MPYRLRNAMHEDEVAIAGLIPRSIRALGANDYTPAELERALGGPLSRDTILIRDQTYFVIMSGEGDVVACGGWSRRRTLFGSDARGDRDDSWLDPAKDAAKIRAFFVDPAHARRGLGRILLDHCEAEAG